MTASLNDIAVRAGVSVKTVSGALHGGSARMSEETRQRIKEIAEELGYVTNFAARSMRQGWMPLVGLVADDLITSPFATEIIRGLDGAVRAADMAVFAMTLGGHRSIASILDEMRRFRPRAIAYAAMYHKSVDLPPEFADAVGVMINCRDANDRVTSLVPDETGAALEITNYLIDAGRRNIAFINLPGLLAGELRELGFRRALDQACIDGAGAIVLPAVSKAIYSDRAHSLVATHVQALMNGPRRPDAILCGNDRVAMEVYAALRREGAAIPDDVAIASFDNQVEIASRLDPPLTTMALPHRAMGRQAAQILLAEDRAPVGVQKLPFQLVERASV
ncbi:LacI family transcriptional regulator protein (plasmid) [Rhizobium phaseoli]|uniref:LacI family DNA-binding transcriptional regulator n=1 Tax=Rhizobium phaseoli TaxID=396 RepID=UPI0007E96324|nr:LacI family DNA-binding transcriptional regulator [Rhizobium phaseoli]ANL31058.1 LacI family transcriptional regulator protein [Rhizobium phaseoli]ANL68991.1 LacI family transcriptional regulator protein [Rhizobium phaseoli]ANL75446.1 LacI family transcriptional regulator protein [Rhizobium phaseoli]ANL81790.1 LacI family transcriptional regulator protein [Rhizobium phaseoli]